MFSQRLIWLVTAQLSVFALRSKQRYESWSCFGISPAVRGLTPILPRRLAMPQDIGNSARGGLGGHAKAASRGQFKTGQSRWAL